MSKEESIALGWVLRGASGLLIVVTGIVCLCAWGCPQYQVYKEGMSGEAKLKEAESSRQILIREAHAKREAAKDLALAEIERAKGVAEANKIIGEGLKGNHEYLMYLWIHSLSEPGMGHQIIYVPTEGGLPILEASRLVSPIRGLNKEKEAEKGKKATK